MVTINSGNVGGDVYGNDVDAAFSPVSNNTVILSGGSVGGDILGGANNGAVTDNNVAISGFGSVLGSVYGGYGAAEGTVNGNDVSIFDSGSVTGNVLGGYSRSVSTHVIGNTVTISGGTVRDIYGGQSGKGNALATPRDVGRRCVPNKRHLRRSRGTGHCPGKRRCHEKRQRDLGNFWRHRHR